MPKGVPTEPGVKHLAVQVEDHPLDYVHFTGAIPNGEYGAGTVEIWDEGEFQLDRETPDLWEFTLKGKKLSGEYVIIYTNGKNWLLMKRKSKAK